MNQAASIICPQCNNAGKGVKAKTIKSLIKDASEESSYQGYYLCLSPDCEVAYFGEQIFYKDDLIVPIWFKDKSPDCPICYCQGVTRGDILEHIAIRKCCNDLIDIQQHTGANTGKECLTRNPAGT